ncbi:hypothetical protein K8354_06830 [Polaribacter litorisediminis]|uniref:hypothetical protein n=1 Tax=Polaribacter litorisediminis TaxID=1908341 RepID=UPI001CBCDE5B|nr:hypothetical protein [Polaribacter litorisediminis]UAM99517.1 hypothetical protein K8354_06830 [Polaribacter litorisediminis]
MFFRLFSYFKFILKSTNQHGVHSPFMFDFVTKGLYKKRNLNIQLDDFNFDVKRSKKEEEILKKVIGYFQPSAVITNLKTTSTCINNNLNLLYFKNLKDLKDIKVSTLSVSHPNSFIIIKNIHQDKLVFHYWTEITRLHEATVTVDLFYFGIIFFRKEQAKEHFIIRV